MLFDINSVEFAGLIAYGALDTLFLVDFMRLFFLARNGLLGAFPEANPAAGAVFFVNLVIEEPFADACGAFLLPDVGFVLVSKIPQRAQNRVGRSATEGAEGEVVHGVRNSL